MIDKQNKKLSERNMQGQGILIGNNRQNDVHDTNQNMYVCFCVCLCMHVCIYVCVPVHTCMPVCVCMSVCLCIFVFPCVSVTT